MLYLLEKNENCEYLTYLIADILKWFLIIMVTERLFYLILNVDGNEGVFLPRNWKCGDQGAFQPRSWSKVTKGLFNLKAGAMVTKGHFNLDLEEMLPRGF